MQRQRAAEEESAASCASRSTRCVAQAHRALATEQLHLVAPSRDEAIVIERVVPADRRRQSVVAAVTMTRPGRDARLARRRCSGAIVVVAACWRLWSRHRGRLVYLQVFERADLCARAERQQSGRSRRRPSAATSSIAAAACSRRASTPTRSTPCRRESTTRGAPRSDLRALGDCTRRSAGARRAARQQRAFAYVQRQVSPDQARRVAALNLDGVGFIKESKRFYPNKELAAHLLGYVGIDNTG
jgi:hypothetical protein